MSTVHNEENDEIVYDEPPFRMVPDTVAFHDDLKDVDVRLFIAFVWFARGGRGAFPGRKAIAKKIKKSSVRTIDEAINRLIAAGFLTVTPRYHENGARKSNVYRLYSSPLPEGKRQPRPGADVRKPDAEDPEQKIAQGGQAENCPGPEQESAQAPEQISAQQMNETNEKRDEEERDLAADAASAADDPSGEESVTTLFAVPDPSPKPATRATSAPDTFPVTAAMGAWARERGITVNLAMETEQFLDFHRAKGSKFKDWPAAWRTWMRNTLKFAAGGPRSSGTPGNHWAGPSGSYNPDDPNNEQIRRAWG